MLGKNTDIGEVISEFDRLSKTNRTLFQKIMDTIKDWLDNVLKRYKNRNTYQDIKYITDRLSRLYDSGTNKTVDNSTENGVKYSYDEYNSIVMSWANETDRKSGDTKVFNRNGKEFVLVMADGNGKYTEIKSGNYEEVKAEYDGYISEQTDRIDEITEILETGQRQYNGRGGIDGVGRGNNENIQRTEIQTVQNDSTGNNEYLRSSDNGVSSKINTENEASNEGAFSMPENSNIKYSLSDLKVTVEQDTEYLELAKDPKKNEARLRTTQYQHLNHFI